MSRDTAKRRPPYRTLSVRTLEHRYRFFRAYAGYRVGYSAADAVTLARAEMAAEDIGLEVTWHPEEIEWDGDGPAPPIFVCATVADPKTGRCIASLGAIGLCSWSDPYVRVVSAELFQEALEALAEEARREACELAKRATLAGPYR